MLTRKEVEEIALLARLHLEPDELDRMGHELGAILDHFGALAAVHTTGVAPLTHALPAPPPLPLRAAPPPMPPAVPVAPALRLDEPTTSLPVADAIRGAAKRDGELFVVPAI